MKTRSFRLLLLCVLFATCAMPQAAQPQRKKLLVVGASNGYQHDAITHCMGTIWKLGIDTKLWDTWIRTDSRFITKKSLPDKAGRQDPNFLELNRNTKNLNFFDAVVFYTTGALELDDEQKAALLSFIKDDGKAFIAIHSAIEAVRNWPEYNEMVGGTFDLHPWNKEVGVLVLDHSFPATKDLPDRFTITDEIYQVKNYSADKVHELMKVDISTVDLKAPLVHRTDNDFALAWEHSYGKGRVFYCGFGHLNEVFDRPEIQKMLVEAIKWATGITPSRSH